jgi:hypothetical protein
MMLKTLGTACALAIYFIASTSTLAKTPATNAGSAGAASTANQSKAGDFVEIGGTDEADTTRSAGASADGKSAKGSVHAGDDEAAKPAFKENEQIKSGTVRVLRKLGMTEAFFKDLPDSYLIPSGPNYSGIYKALSESEKSGTPVSFKVNTKSRRILSLEEAGPGAAGTTNSGSDGKAGSVNSGGTK